MQSNQVFGVKEKVVVLCYTTLLIVYYPCSLLQIDHDLSLITYNISWVWPLPLSTLYSSVLYKFIPEMYKYIHLTDLNSAVSDLHFP